MCRFSTRQQQVCWTWLAVTPAPAQPSPAPHRADGQPTSPCRPDHPTTTLQTQDSSNSAESERESLVLKTGVWTQVPRAGEWAS